MLVLGVTSTLLIYVNFRIINSCCSLVGSLIHCICEEPEPIQVCKTRTGAGSLAQHWQWKNVGVTTLYVTKGP